MALYMMIMSLPALSHSIGVRCMDVSINIRAPEPNHMGLVSTKPVFGGSDKARLNPVSSATETS